MTSLRPQAYFKARSPKAALAAEMVCMPNRQTEGIRQIDYSLSQKIRGFVSSPFKKRGAFLKK